MAILTNNITGVSVEVHATTEHPDSSYGIPVWVDDNNIAYMQVGALNPFYTITEQALDSTVKSLSNGYK